MVALSGDMVGVRIDDPGHYGETISGIELKKDEVVWDAPYGWTPCW